MDTISVFNLCYSYNEEEMFKMNLATAVRSHSCLGIFFYYLPLFFSFYFAFYFTLNTNKPYSLSLILTPGIITLLVFPDINFLMAVLSLGYDYVMVLL
jgi:hypothetical protein